MTQGKELTLWFFGPYWPHKNLRVRKKRILTIVGWGGVVGVVARWGGAWKNCVPGDTGGEGYGQ